jgi:hypothetical protein
LLVKHRDEYADSSWNIEATALSRSVLSGRTLEALAKNPRPGRADRRFGKFLAWKEKHRCLILLQR